MQFDHILHIYVHAMNKLSSGSTISHDLESNTGITSDVEVLEYVIYDAFWLPISLIEPNSWLRQ